MSTKPSSTSVFTRTVRLGSAAAAGAPGAGAGTAAATGSSWVRRTTAPRSEICERARSSRSSGALLSSTTVSRLPGRRPAFSSSTVGVALTSGPKAASFLTTRKARTAGTGQEAATSTSTSIRRGPAAGGGSGAGGGAAATGGGGAREGSGGGAAGAGRPSRARRVSSPSRAISAPSGSGWACWAAAAIISCRASQVSSRASTAAGSARATWRR